MTPQQTKLYRWAASQAKKGMETIQGRKITTKEWDAKREAWHMQYGGCLRSAGLTNDALDKVLAEFFSWSHAADVGLQMDQIDQPAVRCSFVAHSLLDQISAILEQKGREKEAVKAGPGRDAYLVHIARRVSGNDSLTYGTLTEEHWIEIIIRLRYRFDQVQRAGYGREAKRHRPLDNDHIARPQDRRKPIQPALIPDEDYEF